MTIRPTQANDVIIGIQYNWVLVANGSLFKCSSFPLMTSTFYACELSLFFVEGKKELSICFPHSYVIVVINSGRMYAVSA
jgi:hypothetical protein